MQLSTCDGTSGIYVLHQQKWWNKEVLALGCFWPPSVSETLFSNSVGSHWLRAVTIGSPLQVGVVRVTNLYTE